MVTGSDIR